jgi:hypothetical protein
MKNLKLSIVASVASLLLGASAFGNSYTDIQNPNVQLGGLLSSKSYSGTFYITTPGSSSYTIAGYPSGNGTFTDQGGYITGTPITSATASFYIEWGGFVNGVVISLNNHSADASLNWISGQADFVVNGNAGVVSVLVSNGQLEYEVDCGALLSSVTLEYAMLQATTDPNSDPNNRVPDGGATAALLGLGLLGLAGGKRMLASVK